MKGSLNDIRFILKSTTNFCRNLELFREIDFFIGSENFLADISQQQKKIELRLIEYLNRQGLLQRS